LRAWLAAALLALHTGASLAESPLAGARLTGQGTLTWFGLRVYEARLWTAAGFEPGTFARHPFALDLTYQRALRGRDIAQRSIAEMRNAGPFSDAQALQWRERMEAIFPDVKDGDRITGIHRPGRGAGFLVNGKPAGEIADAQFAQLFFAIWLAPTTSEPGLRAALLGEARP
jgi:hypothetical protein